MFAAATLWKDVFASGIVLCTDGRRWLQAAAARVSGLQNCGCHDYCFSARVEDTEQPASW